MLITQFAVSSILFITGVYGILNYRRSILIILMCIELMLLSININFILFSTYLNDISGQIFALFILTVAAAEAAVGLAILILYNRQRNNIFINDKILLKF